MKYIRSIAIFLLLLTLFSSCKKHDSKEIPFEGYWELRSSVGFIVTHYEPNKGNVLYFAREEYKVYDKGMLADEGTYTIIDDNTLEESVGLVSNGQFLKRISFIDSSIPWYHNKIFFEHKGDELIIVGGYFPNDAGVRLIYRKINNFNSN